MITTIPPDDDWPDDGELPPPPPNPDDGNGRRRGRKPECTPQVIDATSKMLIAGNYLGDAARRLGFRPATFSRWRKLGRQFPDGVYAQFSKAVDASIAEYRTRTVGEITSSLDLRLRLELLGRQFPEDFGPFRGLTGQLKKALAATENERAELRAVREQYLALMDKDAGASTATSE